LALFFLSACYGKPKIQWRGLTDGFVATAAALPELAKPEFLDLSDSVQSHREAIAAREADRAKAAAAAAGGAPGGAVPGGPGAGGPADLAEAGKAAPKTTVQNLQSFAGDLLAGAFGREGVAEKQLAAQQEQVTVLQVIAETNRQLKENLTNFVRGGNWGRGPRAVAAGPK
jgi:hypothetical protein